MADPTRLDALEIHAAHQEHVIAELHDALQAQWRRIEALERQVLRLRDEMQQMAPPAPGGEPPPPHY